MVHPHSVGLPTRAALHETGLYLALQAIAPDALQDPFMQQTVDRLAAQESFSQIVTSDLGVATPGSAPAGIVFHVGRCGSTLISQCLKAHPGLVVYSEPLPFNEILSLEPPWTRAQIVAALRSLGTAFADHAGRPYVLKLSSWSTLFCDLVVAAFPATPWVFCVRDPLEVGEAIVRDRPPWFLGETAPARHITRVADSSGASDSSETFFAMLYAAFCEAVLRLDPSRGALVRHADLPDAILGVVARHFAIELDDRLKSEILGRSARDAKAPLGRDRTFIDDSAAKRAGATEDLRSAVDAIARPAFERLLNAFSPR